MDSVGQTIRKIRLSKKISSEALYGGLLSRQARSKFEKGESDTTVSKFFMLLDRLNLSLDEFYVALTQKESVEFHLFSNIALTFYKKDIDGLKLLIKKLNNEHERTNNIKYQHYEIMVQNMLNILEGKPQSIEFAKLSDYLANCDSWGYYEIMLFSNSIDYFTKELINIVFKRVKNTIVKFQLLRRYRNEYSMLLLNIINKGLLDFDFSFALKYFEEYELLAEPLQNDMYYQTMRKFFYEIICACTNKDHSTHELEKIIEYLGYFNMKNKQKQCIELLERLHFHVEKINNEKRGIFFEVTKS
ncbi:helix-turn-helix domain-containing protein [Metasolibacillus fluoroglycofenilyticus]|uniref:helix-turn-helix domain-containing protein n=1 Tax=Metasolibacillus fluoroglycofenilyticus TaxID=1239396 RepID=UPI000D340A6C|nr:Rgg/GadR/MutR family transcriptional regulator [Metasolibacillus fluoroglycofenilyticus]